MMLMLRPRTRLTLMLMLVTLRRCGCCCGGGGGGWVCCGCCCGGGGGWVCCGCCCGGAGGWVCCGCCCCGGGGWVCCGCCCTCCPVPAATAAGIGPSMCQWPAAAQAHAAADTGCIAQPRVQPLLQPCRRTSPLTRHHMTAQPHALQRVVSFPLELVCTCVAIGGCGYNPRGSVVIRVPTFALARLAPALRRCSAAGVAAVRCTRAVLPWGLRRLAPNAGVRGIVARVFFSVVSRAGPAGRPACLPASPGRRPAGLLLGN
jgi:hypothetical protein